MPRKKKASFIPKKKKTLIPEPNWDKLKKSKTEEQKVEAFRKSDDFVHFEVPDREQMHWMKKWIREVSGWDLHEESVILPDVYMLPFAKYGWLAVRLGFTPETVVKSLEKNLKPLLERATEIRNKNSSEAVVLPSDENHFLNPSKVKKWLEVWKSYLKSSEKLAESKDPKLRMQYQVAETYVYNMSTYLRTGIWNDDRFGENREHKVMWVCKALAYNSDGTPKRNVGTWYPDIGEVWTREMNNEA